VRLVNLEGFGMPATTPDQAADRLGPLDGRARAPLHRRPNWRCAPCPDAAGVARRLMKTNPRLGQDKADWLARHWARQNEAGEWQMSVSPPTSCPMPILCTASDEIRAIHARISMPTLMLEAAGDRVRGLVERPLHPGWSTTERMRAIPRCRNRAH
jgi:hypothetical protein